MSWREMLAAIEGPDTEPAPLAIPAIPAIPETDGATDRMQNRQSRQNRHDGLADGVGIGSGIESPESPESPADPAADLDMIDLQLEAADLIRRSGVECLTVADLDIDTVFNVCHFAKLGTAARPGLRVWFRALAAAKRSEAGLGLASAPAGHEHLVGVARRGAWSRLLTIEQKVDSLALVEHLVELIREPCRYRVGLYDPR